MTTRECTEVPFVASANYKWRLTAGGFAKLLNSSLRTTSRDLSWQSPDFNTSRTLGSPHERGKLRSTGNLGRRQFAAREARGVD